MKKKRKRRGRDEGAGGIYTNIKAVAELGAFSGDF
jgi:hypothetical protein